MKYIGQWHKKFGSRFIESQCIILFWGKEW